MTGSSVVVAANTNTDMSSAPGITGPGGPDSARGITPAAGARASVTGPMSAGYLSAMNAPAMPAPSSGVMEAGAAVTVISGAGRSGSEGDMRPSSGKGSLMAGNRRAASRPSPVRGAEPGERVATTASALPAPVCGLFRLESIVGKAVSSEPARL